MQPKIYYYHYLSGKILVKEYKLNGNLNGVLHRINGPAVIQYYRSGIIEKKEYWIKGLRHRLNGPARILYNESGKIYRTDYWINNVYLTDFCSFGLFKRSIVKEIFKYISNHPEFIKEIEILAKYNKWLNKNELMLLNTLSTFKS